MGCGSRPVLRCAHPRRHRRSRVVDIGRVLGAIVILRWPSAGPAGGMRPGRACAASCRTRHPGRPELRPARTADDLPPPRRVLGVDPEEETDARPFDQHAPIFDVDVAGRVRRRPRPEPEHPLGVGGERLHEWLSGARGLAAGRRQEGGVVNASTRGLRGGLGRHRGDRSWAATCSAAGPGRGATIRGRAGGATTRRSTRPCSCSRTTPRAPLECAGGTTFTLRHRRASRRRWSAARAAAGRRGTSPSRRRRERRPAVPGGAASSTR